jgi:hypothetical protein
METCLRVAVQIHLFLTSALAGGEWSASRPCRFTPGERASGTHCIGGWVRPRAGVDDIEKSTFLTLPGLEVQPLGRPGRSQSLYRLRYPRRQYITGDANGTHDDEGNADGGAGFSKSNRELPDPLIP